MQEEERQEEQEKLDKKYEKHIDGKPCIMCGRNTTGTTQISRTEVPICGSCYSSNDEAKVRAKMPVLMLGHDLA